MKLADRVDSLQAAVEDHLRESGSIKADIAALKDLAKELKDVPAIVKRVEKAFWIVFVAVIGVVVSNYWRPRYVNQQSVSQVQQKP